MPLFLASCTNGKLSPLPLVVNDSTTSLSGWFDATGEWTLFPVRDSRNYDPYTITESAKCVSLVNGTGRQRSDWEKLDREKVKIFGTVTRYDYLDSGKNEADMLFARKYYKDQAVHNFCLRDYVFVVENILSASKP